MLAGLGGAVSAILWGLVLLSVLVFVHEGGHFLAARALGIRVREFFLGMPCRFRLAWESRRYGTVCGATPLLLGGYTMVCGMDGASSPHLARALASVAAHGRATVDQVAADAGCTADEAVEALATLADWGSVAPYYDPELGERPTDSTWPSSFETLERDPSLLTKYDRGHDFSLPGTTAQGEPHGIGDGPEAFLAAERSHTYLAHGFWGRTFVLVSGVAVNLVCGILLVVAVLTLAGVPVVGDVPVAGSVTEGSLAQQAGIEAGDEFVSVDGAPVSTWQGTVEAVREALSEGTDFTITVRRDGRTVDVGVALDGPAETLGIQGTVENVRLGIGEAFSYALSYVGATASFILRLLQPAHIGEVIESSSSVVGISVMASEAASQGAASFALLAAAVSLSLAFMNLLPVPPLDGGKVVIEAIQAVRRRPVSMRVQQGVSMVGIALFMLLFFVLLRQDIVRFVLGG